MLSQAVDSAARCTKGLNMQDLLQHMEKQNDKLFERVVDSNMIAQIKDFLVSIPNFDYSILDSVRVDSWAVFLGNQHAHLIGLYRGCSNIVLDVDLMLTTDLLRVLGIHI